MHTHLYLLDTQAEKTKRQLRQIHTHTQLSDFACFIAEHFVDFSFLCEKRFGL